MIWAGGGLAVFTNLLGAAQSAATMLSPCDQGTEAPPNIAKSHWGWQVLDLVVLGGGQFRTLYFFKGSEKLWVERIMNHPIY